MTTDLLSADIPARIEPRRNATSQELKLLGLALANWSEQELRPGGLLRTIDNIVLSELLGGDDPTEVVFAILYGETDDDCLTILRRTPPHSDPARAARQLIVGCCFHKTGFDRRRAIDSLRQALPAELVESVLIDGRSWDMP